MKTRLLIASLLILGGVGAIRSLFISAEKPETQPQPVAVTSAVKKPKHVPQSVVPADATITFSLIASFDETSNFNPSNVNPNTPTSN